MKLKARCCLAAPISVATKLTEDTMTYLNQGQAYEIKLENITDVAEAKKGFMCSIINIGFHERHMQQIENELWQQWSHQHPNEKIFSVDMKLSYNVFGVESDGLNKYEFLWDSSKAAGVFIRINSISTEFTAKKHGGEKGVPFKLSIETFSYNSKTHESYFISAACCQIKVFKPKGAERKFRSDRDKIHKRPPVEQDKYHKSCDHTIFKECSLTSLHPMADGSICYYRHSHGHFASKQVVSASSVAGTSSVQDLSQSANDLDHVSSPSQHINSPDEQQDNEQQSEHDRSSQANNDSEPDDNVQGRDYQSHHNNNNSNTTNNNNNNGNNARQQHQDMVGECSKNRSTPDYSSTRQNNQQCGKNNFDHDIDQNDIISSPHHNSSSSETNYNHHHSNNHSHHNNNHHNHSSNHNHNHNHNHSNNNNNNSHTSDLLQQTPFNPMYHGNSVRGVSSLSSVNNAQHFGIPYYGHPLPTTMPPHIAPASNYGMAATNALNNITHQGHGSHAFPVPHQQHLSVKGVSSIYRQLNHDKQINCATQFAHGTSFKASNLAISSSHSNFPNYLANTSSELCNDTSQLHEMKDSGAGSGGSIINDPYHNDNYDSHPLPFQANSSIQLPSIRQRSASISLAGSAGPCSSYTSQARHSEAPYFAHSSGNSNSALDTPLGAGQWCQNSTANSNSNHSSNNSQRNNLVGSNGAQDGHSSYGAYDCANNQHYDSDANNSPNKSQHNTSESSSSCCSRSKNNSSLAPYSGGATGAVQPDSNEHDSAKFCSRNNQITVNSDCHEVAAWFIENRFVHHSKTFNNFSGSDLLRLSKTDLIEICGLIDGIRLYNSLHNTDCCGCARRSVN